MPIELINNTCFYVDEKINTCINDDLIDKLIDKDNKGKSFFLIKKKKVYVDINSNQDKIKVIENFIFVKDNNIYFKLNDGSISIINGKINDSVIIAEFEGRKQKKNLNSDKFRVYNQYFLVKNELDEEFYMMYTTQDIFFSFSKEDKDTIVNYGVWSFLEQSNRIQSQNKPLYNLLTDKYIIYKNGNRLDYRKENLIETENKGDVVKEAKKKKIPQEVLNELQVDTLPEYISYYQEEIDTNKYIKYFTIESCPQLYLRYKIKLWHTPLENKYTLKDKFNMALKKLDELNENYIPNISQYLLSLMNNLPQGIYFKEETCRNYFVIDRNFTGDKDIKSTTSNLCTKYMKLYDICRKYEHVLMKKNVLQNENYFNWDEMNNCFSSDELDTLNKYSDDEITELISVKTKHLPENCNIVNTINERYYIIKKSNGETWKQDRGNKKNFTQKTHEFIEKYNEFYPDCNDLDKLKIIKLTNLL